MLSALAHDPTQQLTVRGINVLRGRGGTKQVFAKVKDGGELPVDFVYTGLAAAKAPENIVLACTLDPFFDTAKERTIFCEDSSTDCTFEIHVKVPKGDGGKPPAPPSCHLESLMFERKSMFDRLTEARKQLRRSALRGKHSSGSKAGAVDSLLDYDTCGTGDAEFSGTEMLKVAIGLCEAFGAKQQTLDDAAKFPCGLTDNKDDARASVVGAFSQAKEDSQGGLTFYMKYGFTPVWVDDLPAVVAGNRRANIGAQAMCNGRAAWCKAVGLHKNHNNYADLVTSYEKLSAEVKALPGSLNSEGAQAQRCKRLNLVGQDMFDIQYKDYKSLSRNTYMGWMRFTDGLPCGDKPPLKPSGYRKQFCPYPVPPPVPSKSTKTKAPGVLQV